MQIDYTKKKSTFKLNQFTHLPSKYIKIFILILIKNSSKIKHNIMT